MRKIAIPALACLCVIFYLDYVECVDKNRSGHFKPVVNHAANPKVLKTCVLDIEILRNKFGILLSTNAGVQNLARVSSLIVSAPTSRLTHDYFAKTQFYRNMPNYRHACATMYVLPFVYPTIIVLSSI